eukprot:gene1063-2081_t
MACPDHRLTSRVSEKISFSVAEIPCKSDEDRHYFSLPDESSSNGISSFGIFDGHGGDYASTQCARHLHEIITSRNMEFLTKLYKDEDFDLCYEMDQMLCESARVATVELDKRICQDSTAGTTAVSLFLFPCPDGSTRVYCPWVGDSRCCMFTVENGQPISVAMSIDHSPSLERESVRIQCRQELIWTGMPIEISKSPPSCIPSKPLTKSPTVNLSEDSDMSVNEENDVGNDDNSQDHNIVKEVGHSSIPGSKRLSYIDRRSGKGAKGPLVVFNGCGGSIMMTRSIGDRQ